MVKHNAFKIEAIQSKQKFKNLTGEPRKIFETVSEWDPAPPIPPDS